MTVEDLEYDLIESAINLRTDKWRSYISNFFWCLSDMQKVKDIIKYKINEEIEDEPLHFVYDLSDMLLEIRVIRKICKQRDLHEDIVIEIEGIQTAINTIIRSCKKKLQDKLNPILENLSEIQIEKYNTRVIKYFKYNDYK